MTDEGDALGPRFERIDGPGPLTHAHDRELGQRVALELVDEDAAALRARVAAVRRVHSPRVGRVHEVAELTGGAVAVVMDPVDGRPLRELVEAGGTDWRRVARWAADVADGLATAHALDVVHGALDRDAVVIDREDRAVIIGFARRLARGQRSEDDLHALGILASEALTGETITESSQELRIEAPFALANLLRVLLSDAAASAHAVRDELLAIGEADEPSLTTVISVPARAPREPLPEPRRPKLAGVIVAVVAALGAAVGAALLVSP